MAETPFNLHADLVQTTHELLAAERDLHVSGGDPFPMRLVFLGLKATECRKSLAKFVERYPLYRPNDFPEGTNEQPQD